MPASKFRAPALWLSERETFLPTKISDCDCFYWVEKEVKALLPIHLLRFSLRLHMTAILVILRLLFITELAVWQKELLFVTFTNACFLPTNKSQNKLNYGHLPLCNMKQVSLIQINKYVEAL